MKWMLESTLIKVENFNQSDELFSNLCSIIIAIFKCGYFLSFQSRLLISTSQCYPFVWFVDVRFKDSKCRATSGYSLQDKDLLPELQNHV